MLNTIQEGSQVRKTMKTCILPPRLPTREPVRRIEEVKKTRDMKLVLKLNKKLWESASLCQTDGGGAGGGEGGDGSRPQRKELNAGRRVVAIPWSIWSRWVGVGEEELVATTIITITNNFFVNPVVASMVILDMMTRGASLLEEDTLKSIERSDSQYHVKSANQFFFRHPLQLQCIWQGDYILK